jgi:hypothetical protein
VLTLLVRAMHFDDVQHQAGCLPNGSTASTHRAFTELATACTAAQLVLDRVEPLGLQLARLGLGLDFSPDVRGNGTCILSCMCAGVGVPSVCVCPVCVCVRACAPLPSPSSSSSSSPLVHVPSVNRSVTVAKPHTGVSRHVVPPPDRRDLCARDQVARGSISSGKGKLQLRSGGA